MRDVVLIALGGAVGSVLRYGVGWMMGPTADARLPWHTFAVNISGAFVLGALIAIAARHGWPGWWRPLLAVGLLGGYTTFSTFTLESTEFLRRGMQFTSLVYAAGSVILGMLAAWTGILVGRAVS